VYSCERIWNYQLVIQTISELWDEIAEDNAPPYKPDIVDEVYVAILFDKTYVGMYRLHQLNSVMWKGHAFILKEMRKEHSLQSGYAIQKWVLENIPDLQMMVVDVPECFKNVLAFVKKIGFKEMGFIPDCYTKNGLVGLHQLGMSKEEMKCQQQQQ